MMPSMGKRVLLVDDDQELIALLSMKLSQAGYDVQTSSKASEGFRMALRNTYDAVVLDMVMPRMTGVEICRGLRSRGVLTPVLILSGRAEKSIVVQGLNAGADDYLTKPFTYTELVARIQALVRRHKKTYDSQSLACYDIVLDVTSGVVSREDDTMLLTKKEALLLKRLMSEAPKAVPRLTLLEDVWGIGADNASNRLDVYIRRLRSKLKALSGSYRIHTIRGSGYYFDKS